MNQTPNSNSILYRAVDPVWQAGIIITAILVIMLGHKLVGMTGAMDPDPLFPWLTAASFILVFALFNSIFSLSAANVSKYWSRSMMSFIGLAAGSGLLAWLFSQVSIGDAGSYKWIYLVLSVGYLVFMSMVGFMRQIVEFAQREEWNSPKMRSRKRK